jgi:Mg2+ and Co2+ transporter CorA
MVPDVKNTDLSIIPSVSRVPVLLVGSMNNVVVLTRNPVELPKEIDQRLQEEGPHDGPLVRGTFAMLKAILRRYAGINEVLERALIDIESRQAGLSDRIFLDQTFRLRGEITRVRSSLKHLADVLTQLAEKPVAIKGFENAPRAQFAVLADDAENLYESVDDHLDTLGALVDLCLNVSSFQMNKVMRLLAILTALALVRAVAGGLLGMNLSDNPWSPTLAQVTFGVAVGMALSLYVFAVKGWLR